VSDPVIIAIVVALQTTISAGLAAWLKRGNDANHRDTQGQIEVVRQDVNGKMADMLKLKGEAGEAKGHADEKANPT